MGKQNDEKIQMSLSVQVPENLAAKKLDEMAQELVEPLKKASVNVDIADLKRNFGEEIGTIAISSLHDDKLKGILGAAGYDGKLWEKACC